MYGSLRKIDFLSFAETDLFSSLTNSMHTNLLNETTMGLKDP